MSEITQIEHVLLKRLIKIVDLNDWQRNFLADLTVQIESGETSRFSHKQRAAVWRMAFQFKTRFSEQERRYIDQAHLVGLAYMTASKYRDDSHNSQKPED